MARLGLEKNRKFTRLAHGLNTVLPGMAAVLARGLLETLWSAAYDRADDFLGDAADVEIAAGWTGTPGLLTQLLLEAGGDGAPGFIERDADRGGYRLHALWEHAPPWVRRKAERAAVREAVGKTLADVRRAAGQGTQYRTNGTVPANGQHSDRQMVDRLPATPWQKTASGREGKGREGKGRDPENGLTAGAPPPPISSEGFSLSPPDPEGPPARAHARSVRKRTGGNGSGAAPELRTRAAALLGDLNAARAEVLPGSRPLGPLPCNLEHLIARLVDGHSDEDVRHVIRLRAREVELDSGAARWFAPATIFRPDHFERSIAMRVEDLRPPKGTGDRVMNPASRRKLAEEF